VRNYIGLIVLVRNTTFCSLSYSTIFRSDEHRHGVRFRMIDRGLTLDHFHGRF
jgi:hypothetical protein